MAFKVPKNCSTLGHYSTDAQSAAALPEKYARYLGARAEAHVQSDSTVAEALGGDAVHNCMHVISALCRQHSNELYCLNDLM